MKRDAAFDGHVPGNVYAQPLYWHPPGAARGLVIVATEEKRGRRAGRRHRSRVWHSAWPPSRSSKLACGKSTRSASPARR